MSRLFLNFILVFSLVLPAMAADTIETWDKGAADFEIYFGASDLGADSADHAINGSAVMGWGVAERFSAFMTTSFTSDSYLNNADPELTFGAFGTPVDTEGLDLDLGFAMKIAGPELNQASLVPFGEINLDHSPDLSTYGVYLRATADIFGVQNELDESSRSLDLNLLLGTYYSLSPHQQLLLEIDLTIHDDPDPGPSNVEKGGLGLGYNAMLNNTLELITEARLNIPDDNENYTIGFFVGFIATLE